MPPLFLWYLCDRRRGFLHLFRSAFKSAVYVPDPSRVYVRRDDDPDTQHLAYLNREWRRMFYGDPWMVALMTHVRFLRVILMLIMALLIHVRIVYPDASFVGNIPVATLFALSVPYWIWIGIWYRRIEVRVFSEFKKRFGAYYHLR